MSGNENKMEKIMPATLNLPEGSYLRYEFTANENHCPVCGTRLNISQHTAHGFWTFHGMVGTISKEKKCTNPLCELKYLRFRPAEPRLMSFRNTNLGMDIVLFVGEQRRHRRQSSRKSWNYLKSRDINLSQRTIQNAFHYYLSIFDAEKPQNINDSIADHGLILALDAIPIPTSNCLLIVLMEVISGQILFAQRTDYPEEIDCLKIIQTGINNAKIENIPVWNIKIGHKIKSCCDLELIRSKIYFLNFPPTI